MKLKIITLLFFCLGMPRLFAQSPPYQIKGTITDTAATYKMVNTTITVLNAKDSTLVKFGRANADGSFALQLPKHGKFILLATYPGYADYAEDFQLDSVKREKDFGHLNMTLKATLLAGVIIKGNAAAIKIKGDTTEFNAASYKIQPNSKVEDLLKQLPGITVDRDGKITAQGQAVKKVLVDGEEFFGDDPTLVTKNLRGDMVDKVQLYDKKSDQATFTGIDDGQKTKTINIKLKEDKKNGYFGKANAGIGTDKFYEGEAMINAFKGKKKVSAYGIIGNTGKTGLGWQDSNKYGSSSLEMSDDGNYMYFSGGGGDEMDSFDGRYNGEGIPLSKTGGAHFSNKWNKDKESLNTNYKIGEIRVDGNKTTLSQNNLPDGTINTNSGQSFNKRMFRQKLDGNYAINLDSTTTLKVTLEGALKNSHTEDEFNSIGLREDGSKLNDSYRKVDNESDSRNLNASALLTKKLKKKGRTFSIRINHAYNETKSDGFLDSKINVYKENGDVLSSTPIDQYKSNTTRSNVFNSNITYTEPLTKNLSLAINYGLNVNNGINNRQSFNKSTNGQYDQLDKDFSNDFELNQLSNQGGAIFNFKKGKSVVNIGTKLSGVQFEQHDNYNNTSFKRNFINWNPQASYQYNISQMQSIRFNYNGNTNQPSIDQVQPVRVNTDPQNIRLGNQGLRPSFNSSMYLSYNSYKVMSNQSIYVSGNFGFTNNQITDNVVTDTQTGNSTYQSINLSGKTPLNYGLYMYAGRKIKVLDIDMGLNLNVNGSTNYNMVNNELNNTKSTSISGGLNLGKYKEKKYSFNLSGGPSFNSNKASLQKQLNNDGWGANGNADATVYLPWKIEIGTDANYEYRGKTQTFNQDFERFIWNARISKKFLKSESLKCSVYGNDLLNQNVGFNRSAYNNMITQTNYVTIKRYFMFSVSWDFNKMGGGAPKN